MSSAMARVAVIGSGISGSVCASILAAAGVSVTIFESGRGAGGRTSQRREVMDDGTVLRFDHGTPYFTVSGRDEGAARVIGTWEARGLIAEWPATFAALDRKTGQFTDFNKEGSTKKFVGVPGMNSICKALCQENGVDSKFGITVANMKFMQEQGAWLLIGMDGQELGHFDGVVASDKNVASPRFSSLTGRTPPLDVSQFPELSAMLQDIPVRPCFALMLAFSEPLNGVHVEGFSFKNSELLSWAFCDTSKPGRTCATRNGQSWVLHSSAEYAMRVIAEIGLQKPSADTLAKVAEKMLEEFQTSGLNIPRPLFMKAHRWGSAFPSISIGGEDNCLWDKNTKLAICGDFCASPDIEGAVISGMGAASKILASIKSFSEGANSLPVRL